MQSSVDKFIKEFNEKLINEYKFFINKGVSIITSTNKADTLDNIIANFQRQDHVTKELIIIINKDIIDLNEWINKVKNFNNIRIFKLDENISLGHCLNFGVEKSKYEIIAKFDDDDYYGSKYISDTIKYFDCTDAGVLGKTSNFIYFVDKKLLAIRTPNQERRYVDFANGSTLVFKKAIFNRVKFRDMSLAEDVYFCKDCIKNNIKIYSTHKYYHIYFRNLIKENHTWKINDDKLIKESCQVIGRVKDYISYANNIIKEEL